VKQVGEIGKRGMGRKRGRRAEALRMGRNEGKRKVWVPGETEGLEKVLDRRVDGGFRRGYKRRGVASSERGMGTERSARTVKGPKKSSVLSQGSRGREVELRYTGRGRPVRQERKRRSKPSRARTRSKKEVWGRREESGRARRQTTEGRKRGEEVRQSEVGGVRRRRVK
jgi:hypothetical protein